MSASSANAVASAIDARRAEVRAVEVIQEPDAIRGVFEVSTGRGFRVTLTDQVYEIARDDAAAEGTADG